MSTPKQPRPALLLDVDGVLCPFAESDGYRRHLLPEPGGLGNDWVYISPRNKERLQELASEFDFVWCTGWEHQANKHLLEPHGIPAPLEVIEFGSTVPGVVVRKFSGLQYQQGFQGSWKFPWVRGWAEDCRRPLVWVDDEIGHDDHRWADVRTAMGIPTQVFRTDPNVGLTDEIVAAIKAWIT